MDKLEIRLEDREDVVWALPEITKAIIQGYVSGQLPSSPAVTWSITEEE